MISLQVFFLFFRRAINSRLFHLPMLLFMLALLNGCVSSRVSWSDLEKVRPQAHTFSGHDGTPRTLYRFPARRVATKGTAPAIMFLHGGAWVGGKAETFYAHAAHLADHGIEAFCVEYGLLRREARTIGDCLTDAEAALELIGLQAKDWGVDEGRIMLCGESAGGQLAAGLIMFPPGRSGTQTPKPSALLLLNPVLDLDTSTFLPFLDTAWNDKGYRRPSAQELHDRLGMVARNWSPVHRLERPLPPTLLINGTEDRVTPPSTALRFVQSARELGTRIEYIPLTGQGHAFAVPHYKSSETVVIESLRQMEDFLSNLGCLAGRCRLRDSHAPDWLKRGPL